MLSCAIFLNLEATKTKPNASPSRGIMTDQELVQACLRKDPKAQRALYDQFAGKMMGVCLRYVKDQIDAQDVLQEGFIRVFEKLNQYSGKGSLGGWIRMIMINTALIMIRKKKKFSHHEEFSDAVEFTREDYGILDSLGAEEIIKLIQHLPDGYRTVFNLYAIEGYSHKEIGQMLGVSESTSKTQFFKAKKHLKKAITLLDQI